MTIRPDATKRISSIKIALAFGLAPVLLPALSGSEGGLIVTHAHATTCPDTRHMPLRAERPSASAGVHRMPEVALGDDDVFHMASGTQCGPYDRVAGFQLMSSGASAMTMPPHSFRAVHEGADGDRVETALASWPDGDGQTDFFDGRDPRGVWQVARGTSGPDSSQDREYFHLTLALSDDAQETTAVGQAEASEVPVDGGTGTQAGGNGGGTIGGSGDSSESPGAGTVAEADDDPGQDTASGSSPLGWLDDPDAIEMDTDHPQMQPYETTPGTFSDDDEQTAQTFPGLPTMPDIPTGPDLSDLIPTIDPLDTSQFIPDGEVETVTDGYLEAPRWVEAGRDFTASWGDRLAHPDRVTIVPDGAPDDELGSGGQSLRVANRSRGTLTAPDELGTYEVRYFSSDDDSVYARVTVEVRDPYVEIDVADEVHAGLDFQVDWGDRIAHADRVTIIPLGTPDDVRGDGPQDIRVANRSRSSLVAPDELGIYEVRYWRSQQERVVGSALVEVVDPEITLDVPDTAFSGLEFRVDWGDRIAHADRVTIVPLGTPDDVRGDGPQDIRVANRSRSSLVAPDELGVYEVRYWRSRQERVIGRTIIDVIDPDVLLMAPLEVETGADFRVSWSERIAHADRVTIVPADKPDHELGSGPQKLRVANRSQSRLRAPSEEGDFEVRYWRNSQERVVGRALVTVVPEGSEVASTGEDEDASTEDLIALLERLVDLAARIDQLPSNEQQSIRNELIGHGPSALEMLAEFVDDGRIEPWQAAGFVGGAFNPPPPAAVRPYTGYVPQAGGFGQMPAQAGTMPGQLPPGKVALDQPAQAQVGVQPQTGAQAQTQAQAQPQTEEQAAADTGLSPQDERRVIMLVARLDGASQEEQQAIAVELAQFGPGATDILLELMQEGLVDRTTALRVAAAIEAEDSAEAPTQPTGDAALQEDAGQPSTYRVTGVAPNDMLNVRDRAGVSDSNVIGQLAPEAGVVLRTGDVHDVGGRDWWHVRHPDLPPEGGWVNSRFLASQTGLAPEEQAYRVTGVASDDQLNIRDNPGTDGEIVGRVSPDAAGLHWTGESAAVSDATWWELAHPDLSNGTGWVNSRFLEVQEGVSVADTEPPALSAVAVAFTEAEGYEPGDPSQALPRLLDTMPQTDSVFPPGGNLGPLTKAVLLLENEEGVADHARYRIRYGMEQRSGSPGSAGAQPLPFSFVQVDRFNLGEVFREAIAESFGEARTPPPEAFGAGEHVSYRFEFRPIQGRVADPVAMSRQVIPDGKAQGIDCLTLRCLHLGSVGEGAIPWHEHAGSGTNFDRPYEDTRNGAYTPATMMDLLALESGVAELSDERLRWTGYEGPESVQGSEPFVEAVMDVNLAQEYGVEAVLHEGHVMDDSIAAVWKRAITFPGGGDTPQLSTQRAFECARGDPNNEGLCP